MGLMDETRGLHQRIRGLYGIADAGGQHSDPEDVAISMLKGGCRLVQLRCKGWTETDIVRVGVRVGRHCRHAGAVFILNDHPHLVGSVGAHGVHVGQLDVDTATARAQMPTGSILGRSTHSVEHVQAALDDADYLAFGPIWPTTNTDRDKGSRGLVELAHVRALVPAHVPLVAIGGVRAERLPDLISAGVDAWAVIGSIRDATDRVATTRSLLQSYAGE